MASILPLLKQTAFSPEVTQVMGDAFDHATKGLHDTGQPALVREIIANRIVELAGSGERDPKKLASMALNSLGVGLSGMAAN